MKKLFELVGKIAIDGLERVKKDLDSFDRKIKKAVKPVARYGRQVSHVGKSLTSAFTVPLAVAGGAVVKFGADFNKAMTNSTAIMGNMSKSMRTDMEKTARDVAKTSTFSATQAAEAYFFLASAGLDAAESMEALPKVAKFAQAGNFDLAMATDLLTDAQSALGLSSDDTAESMENMTMVSDVLVKANTIANASTQQFAEALTNRAGAALRLLGKDLTEGAAVLAVFADQGRKGAEAGTMLDIVLRDLQKASIGNREAFEKANIAVFDSQGEMRNMADIVGELEKRFENLSDEQKRAELMTLGFTDKSVAATMALLGTSEAIRKYEKDLKSAAGTTDEVANKQLQSFWAQLDILKSKLIDVALELSETLIPILVNDFLPIVEHVIKKISELAKWFSDLPDSIKKTVVAFAAFVAIAGPALIVMGKLISSITLITTALKAAKLALTGLTAAMAINPFGAAIIAITTLVAGLASAALWYKRLTKHQKTFEDATKDTEVGDSFIDGIENIKKKLEEYGSVINTQSDITKLFGKQIDDFAEEARKMGFTVEGSVINKLQALIKISAELRENIKTTAKTWTENAKAIEKNTEKVKEGTDVKKEQIKTNEEWIFKLRAQTATALELIELNRKKDKKAAVEAEESKETLRAIDAFYNNEKKRYWEEELKRINQEVETNKRAADDKRKAEIEYLTEVRFAALTSLDGKILSLEMQRDAELQRAEESLSKEIELSEAKIAIRKRYNEQIVDLENQRVQEVDSINQAGLDMQKVLGDERLQMATNVIMQLINLANMKNRNDITRLEQKTAKEKEAILSSQMSEERKQSLIQQLEEETDKKKQELMRKQARREKAAAIFSTIINTAQAISKALTLAFPLNIIMAAIVAALGIAQVAIIASQPLPQLAEGGLVSQTPGGRQVIVGEGNDDEAILPMKKGSEAIADRVLSKITNQPNDSKRSVVSRETNNNTEQKTIVNVNVGTLVADDEGLSQLGDRIIPYINRGLQRRGGKGLVTA